MDKIAENKKLVIAAFLVALGILFAVLEKQGIFIDDDIKDAAIEAISEPITDATNQ